MDSSQPLDFSPWKQIWFLDKYGHQTAILEFTTSPLLNIVTVLLLHLLRDKIISKIVWHVLQVV